MNERDRDEITPRLETKLVSELKAILVAVPVGTEFVLEPSSPLCSSLEFAIPRLLRRRHKEWTREGLDGVFISMVRRTGTAAVQIAGTAILITDQTVTPLWLELTLCSSAETIESYRVCLGQPGGGAIGISGPKCSSPEAKELLAAVKMRLDEIPWVYKITSAAD